MGHVSSLEGIWNGNKKDIGFSPFHRPQEFSMNWRARARVLPRNRSGKDASFGCCFLYDKYTTVTKKTYEFIGSVVSWSIQRLLHIYCKMLLFAFPVERTIIYSCTTNTWRIGVSIVIWGYTPYVCRRILFVVPWQIVFVAVWHWNFRGLQKIEAEWNRYIDRHGTDTIIDNHICYWNSPTNMRVQKE